MLPEYEKKSNLGALGLPLVVLAFVILCFGAGRVGGGVEKALLFAIVVMFAVGGVLWLYGLGCYAIGKGYSGVLAFLGVFGPLGLLLLVALPDQHKPKPAGDASE